MHLSGSIRTFTVVLLNVGRFPGRLPAVRSASESGTVSVRDAAKNALACA
jgi:hypothetical protein